MSFVGHSSHLYIYIYGKSHSCNIQRYLVRVSDPIHYGVHPRFPIIVHRMRLPESICLGHLVARRYVLLPVLQLLPTIIQKESKLNKKCEKLMKGSKVYWLDKKLYII
jgi:hypothetical protein